jgi:hypothetical protein
MACGPDPDADRDPDPDPAAIMRSAGERWTSAWGRSLAAERRWCNGNAHAQVSRPIATRMMGRRQIGHCIRRGSWAYVTVAGPRTTVACCTVSSTVTVTTIVAPSTRPTNRAGTVGPTAIGYAEHITPGDVEPAAGPHGYASRYVAIGTADVQVHRGVANDHRRAVAAPRAEGDEAVGGRRRVRRRGAGGDCEHRDRETRTRAECFQHRRGSSPHACVTPNALAGVTIGYDCPPWRRNWAKSFGSSLARIACAVDSTS